MSPTDPDPDPGPPVDRSRMSQEEFDFWSTAPSGPGSAPRTRPGAPSTPGRDPREGHLPRRSRPSERDRVVRNRILLCVLLLVIAFLVAGGLVGMVAS